MAMTTSSPNNTASGHEPVSTPSNGAPASHTAETAASQTAKRPAKATASARKRRTTTGKGAGARTTASRKSSTARATAKRTSSTRAGDYAERVVLIPVGAALMARERVAAGVGDVVSTYSSSSRIEAQLRRFERRGNTARNQLEREVRRTRTRLEREMRQRRREIERRRTRFRRDFSEQVEQVQKQIEKTQTWFEDAVRTSFEDGSDLVNRVQERVLSRD